jgi:hypothetical protein
MCTIGPSYLTLLDFIILIVLFKLHAVKIKIRLTKYFKFQIEAAPTQANYFKS